MGNQKVRIKVSEHAKLRCEQSNVGVGYLIKMISSIPNVQGKLRWMTEKGVIVIERVNEGLILVRTFISRRRYRGRNYNKGCMIF